MAQKPTPFRRPGISLSDGPKRDWRDVPVQSLRADDVVRGKGLVLAVQHSIDVVQVFWKNENHDTYAVGDTVHAFVRV